MKFKVGQIWKDRAGDTWTIVQILDVEANLYPVWARRNKDNEEESFTPDGRSADFFDKMSTDLIEFVRDAVKKVKFESPIQPEDKVKLEFGTVGHDWEFTPLLKVGDKVKRPLGGTGVITEVDGGSRVGYAYRVQFDNGNLLWCEHDEVELFLEKSKKVLNFWEARQAALDGKRVKKVDTDIEFTIDDFKSDDYSFDNYEIKADWEIVEEPKNKTYVVTIYKNYLAEPGGGLVDCRKNGPPLNQIAITVDKNGKFIKGENV